MTSKLIRELIDRIFKEPGVKYELTEFETLGKPIHEILSIYPKTVETGRDAGKTKYYVKSFVPFPSGKEEVPVHVEGGKSAPEEIVRQLWVYKLIHQYGYHLDEIDLEKSVQFGTEVGTKAADIIVYTDATKETPKIIVECKKPKRKDGIEQLKSYMNAKGAPVAVWSNGSDSIILYRPHPKEFDDTLFDIPRRNQQPKDVLEAKKTLLQLRKEFNFKKIVQDLEELVLADSGKDEFNEIFKLIFAKIWDEKEAQENRKSKVVEFRKALDPDITFDRINALFQKAAEEWPGIFRDGEDIELTKRHLQVCVGPIEGVRLMGSNLRVMDDAFEYLLPTEAKKKKGQFFTLGMWLRCVYACLTQSPRSMLWIRPVDRPAFYCTSWTGAILPMTWLPGSCENSNTLPSTFGVLISKPVPPKQPGPSCSLPEMATPISSARM